MNHIGIDVSGKALSIVISVNGKHRKAQSYENTPQDHKRLVALIQKLQGESIVCMEATGMHHFDLAVTLSRSEKITVTVINPKAAHNFAKALCSGVRPTVLMRTHWRAMQNGCRLLNGDAQVKKRLRYALWHAVFPRPTRSKHR